jgi:hypothetical protein
MKRRTLFSISWLTLPVLLRPAIAQRAPAHRRRPLSQEVWRRTELYFGMNRPGGEVSEEDFARFVDCEITPRFPDGLTILTAYGQFLTSSGVLTRERSKVLVLFHPGTGEADRKIEEIRTAYKRAFEQESVLKVEELAYVSF